MPQGPKRIFLGWDRPCLVGVVEYLHQQFAQADAWDLSSLTLVLPVASACRRLQVLLASHSQAVALNPPRLLTPGQLPELLYRCPQPVADPLTSLLVRIHTLVQADDALLSRILHSRPAADDFPAWMSLAQDLSQLQETLAAQGWQVSQVGPRLESALPDFVEAPRWQALAHLQQAYDSVLAAMGCCDLQSARLQAAQAQAVAWEGPLILVGMLDLSKMLRQLLSPLADRVTVLIHAPPSQADRFDDWGALHPSAWMECPIPLADSQIHLVDRPGDQARKAVELLAQIRAETPQLLASAQDVILGMGDAAIAPQIQRALQEAGLSARLAQGTPLSRSLPFLFLQSWAAWLSQRQAQDLAALLRHPDVETCLQQSCPSLTRERSWLTLLDEYLEQHRVDRFADAWPSSPDTAQTLRQMVAAVDALAGDPGQGLKPLSNWGPVIRQSLERVYGSRAVQRGQPADESLYQAIELLAEWLDRLESLPAHASWMPSMTLAQAIGFLLAQVATMAIAPPADSGAIELLGWLELPLDDAPVLLLTGVNEGCIPYGRSDDPFLPDQVRQILGLFDHQRHYARDAAHLTAMLHQRPVLHLIAGRRGIDEEPLMPSRLLLASEPKLLAKRVLAFYAPEKASGGQALEVPRILSCGGTDRFVFPWPVPPAEPIGRLRVTAFRDYLACPYRFYLKHVLKLKAMNPARTELDALQFGTLAHEVLEQFGRSELAASRQPQAIERFLHEQLEQRITRRYGPCPAPAIVLQGIQLKNRLSAFARWQAQQVEQGWSIVPQGLEVDLVTQVEVDGIPFSVHGRIDRMDRHQQTGQWRLLDYKTGDRGLKPQQTHFRTGRWVDLQLPLYRQLIKSLSIQEPLLGYILLPKKVQDVGAALAPWSLEDYESAGQVALQVIRQVRAGVFWPPGPPMDDEWAALCMDEAIDRDERIRRSNPDSDRQLTGDRA